MKLLSDAWNWKPAPAFLATIKARAVRVMGAFLVAILCFTIISRMADALTTPIVTAEATRRMAISQDFSATGTVEADGGTPVMAPSGLPVTEMLVSEGDQVSAGDLLFRCDTSDLAQEIAMKGLDIQSLRIELDALAEDDESQAAKDRREMQRALEDLEALKQTTTLNVASAKEAYRQAEVAYKDYDKSPPDDYTYDNYEKLKAQYISASLDFDRALLEQEESLKKAQRAIDDLADKAVDTAAALKQISLQKQESELAELQRSLSAGGAVYAPADGIVTSLTVAAGKRTTSEAAAIISDRENLRLTTRITGEQKKYVTVGDTVEFTLYGESSAIRNLPILSITPVASEVDQYLVSVDPPEKANTPGQGGEVSFSQRSAVQERCVPLSALYQEGDKYYVLALRETDTVLGTEYIAERIDVTVDEMGSEMAAISGAIYRDAKIITNSDKPLREGDRVRPQS